MFVCIYIDIADLKTTYYLNTYVYVWNPLFGNNLLFIFYLVYFVCLVLITRSEEFITIDILFIFT